MIKAEFMEVGELFDAVCNRLSQDSPISDIKLGLGISVPYETHSSGSGSLYDQMKYDKFKNITPTISDWPARWYVASGRSSGLGHGYFADLFVVPTVGQIMSEMKSEGKKCLEGVLSNYTSDDYDAHSILMGHRNGKMVSKNSNYISRQLVIDLEKNDCLLWETLIEDNRSTIQIVPKLSFVDIKEGNNQKAYYNEKLVDIIGASILQSVMDINNRISNK